MSLGRGGGWFLAPASPSYAVIVSVALGVTILPTLANPYVGMYECPAMMPTLLRVAMAISGVRPDNEN